MNGSDQHRGRVEVQIADQWGTICADNWNRKSAQVACRMLGYNYQYVTKVKCQSYVTK